MVVRPYESCDAAIIARLALGVLGGLAGALESRLLALLDAGIAREEAGLAQRGAQFLIVRHEGARDSVGDGIGPGADAPAGHLRVDVEVPHQFSGLERQAQLVLV